MHNYDIIITGAGMVGSALALALGQQGWRVALLDKNPPPVVQAEMDLRVSSIHLGSQQFLQGLNVALPLTHSGCFDHIKVTQAHSLTELAFSAEEVGEAHLGHIIENNRLVQALQTGIAAQPQVDCHWPVTLTALEQDAMQACLHTAQGQRFTARLIIGADGAQSWLRQQTAITLDAQSYQQQALVAFVHTAKLHARTAYQRFLPSGPLAFLPLADAQTCSIVWSSTPEHIAQLQACDEAAFNQQLTEAFNQRLGACQLQSKRAHFPLMKRHAKRYIDQRVALVGDAIHTLHPLAGQGANLGLADVACLSQVLADAYAKQRDPGCTASLRRYERQRRGANTLMLQTMQVFHQGFTQAQAPWPWLRSSGMHCVARLPLLKRRIIRQAMGLA